MKTTEHRALVTGGASGIGFAIARALASRGNQVVILGRSKARLDEARRSVPDLRTVVADVTREDDLRAALDAVRLELGGLSLLVNNAGVMGRYDFGGDDSLRALEEEVAIDLVAPLRLTSLALPMLFTEPSAAVVNVSSILAYAGAATYPVYSAAKAAVHSFSRSLRVRLRDSPVRVFEVLPPWVDTGLTDGLSVQKVTPESVATAVVEGMARDRYEIRVGQTKALYMLSRVSIRRAEDAVQRAAVPREAKRPTSAA